MYRPCSALLSVLLVGLAGACAGQLPSAANLRPSTASQLRHSKPLPPLFPPVAIASAGPASPSASPAPAPHPSGSLGGDAPMAVAAAAPDGSWVAACQVLEDTNGDGKLDFSVNPRGDREGDPLAVGLSVGGAPLNPIDDLLARDPTGRYLVVRRGEQASLVDSVLRQETDLTPWGADLRDDALPHPEHRALSFDASGQHLLYVKDTGAAATVVVRELGTGQETTLRAPEGRTWRARLDPSGQWAVLAQISEDRDGDGKLKWPVPAASSRRLPCPLPVVRHPGYFSRVDPTTWAVAPLPGGSFRRAPDLVTPLGNRLILRDPTGRLLLEAADGARQELLPAACEGRLLYVDGQRQRALVTCRQKKGKPLLHLVGPGLNLDLGIEVTPRGDSWVSATAQRLIPIYPGQEALLVDLDQNQTFPLKERDLVLSTHLGRALVLREEQLWVVDVDSGDSTDLRVNRVRMPRVLEAGAKVAVDRWLVDLDQKTISAPLPHRPLALTPAGDVLLPRGQDSDGTHLPQGPLEWLTPAAGAP